MSSPIRPSDVIKEKGWGQGRYAQIPPEAASADERQRYAEWEWRHPEAVNFCIYGAVHRAFYGTFDTPYKPKFITEFLDMLEKEVEESSSGYVMLDEWNDHPSRKKEEVIQLLEKIERKFESLGYSYH